MATNRDDIISNVIKASVLFAVVIAGYFLFKKLLGTGSGTGSGSGGTGTGSGSSAGLAGTIHAVADKLEATAETVANKISQNLQKNAAQHFDPQTSSAVNLGLGLAGIGLGNVIPMQQQAPQVKSLVAKLQKADAQSLNYFTKAGSTPQINAALKEVDALPDQDFITTMQAWKAATGYGNLFDSNLAGAHIGSTARSRFLNRLHSLNAA